MGSRIHAEEAIRNVNQPPLNRSNAPNYPPRFEQTKTNGKSIAAMVLGILSLIIPYIGLIFGIIAIVMASLSFKEIRRTGEQGRGMAVAGLVCGIIGTALYTIILLVVIIAGALYWYGF